MANLTSTLSVKLIDGISGPAKGAAAGLGAVAKATEALGKVRGFREQTARLDEMIAAHKRARESVRNLAGQLLSAEAPSNKLQAAYARATAAADKLGNKIEWQKARVRGAASELERMGAATNNLAGAEARLAANMEKATAAIRRQEAAAARSQRRREAIGVVAAGTGVVAARTGLSVGKDAISRAGKIDYALRDQQFATEIDAKTQHSTLYQQAKRIGQDTKFSNEDIVRAQTAFANGLPAQMKTAGVIASVIDQVKNYALTVKNVDMEQSAMAVRGYLLSLGKDISTPEKADKEARSATNKLIRATKIGGMSHDDLMPFIQRGASAGRIAGLSDETMLALAVGMKRSNISGDQSGTALRTLASKLVAPTKKGRGALTAAGISYDDYTTMPGGLSVDNYEKKFREDFGKGLTPSVREALSEAFSDPDIVSNRGAFTEAVKNAVEPLFKKTKDGTMRPSDAQVVSSKAGDFHKHSVESVDAERLLLDILKKDPTLGVLNAFATDKHGNKIGLLAKAFEQFIKDREDLKNVAPDYGDKASALIQGGLGGALERLSGSIETFKTTLGKENEGWLTPLTDRLGTSMDKMTAAVERSPALAAGAGAIATSAAGLAGVFKLVNDMLGGNAPAIALTGSAAALTKSAFLLDAAAAKLAAGSVVDPLKKLGPVAGAITAGGVAAAAGAAAIAGSIAIIVNDHKPAEPGVTKATALPGQEHDDAQRRRKAFNAAQRERFLEERRQLGVIADQGEAAGTSAGTRLGSGMAEGLRAQRGIVEAEAHSVMGRIKSLFGIGVDVPVRMSPSGAAPSPAVPPPKQSSAPPVINNRVTINGVSGSASEIADAVSKAVAEKTRLAIRGAFSDGATG